MNTTRECDKFVAAYHRGEYDGRAGMPSRPGPATGDQRKAYRNGYIDGQQFRAAQKRRELHSTI